MPAQNRFDDRRMLDESLRAFVKALHTDRMVAITGAMSTERLGYPTWTEFVIAYALIARSLAKEILKARGDDEKKKRVSSSRLLDDIYQRAGKLVEDMTRPANAAQMSADQRVSMWTLHELFRAIDREMRHSRAGLVIKNRYQVPVLEEFERRVGAIFLTRLRSREEESMSAAIRPLIRSLGIKRFATLNYDLELERALMLRRDEQLLIKHAELHQPNNGDETATGNADDESFGRFDATKTIERARAFSIKFRNIKSPPTWPASAEGVGQLASVKDFIGTFSSGKPIVRSDRGKISRTMGDGVHVESDIAHRERPDRLFEFAVGSTEISRHIFHLHGRADEPATLVANIRQYDRLYRLDDLYRDPFDHGLRILIGGNPVLFVGIGMNEPEINDYLQYFVSNTPVRRPAPIFVLWNRQKWQLCDSDWKRFKSARRLDFRVRLGVHLIFEDDFERNLPAAGNSVCAASPTGVACPDAPVAALPRLIEALPHLVDRVDRRNERCPDRWRSVKRRLKQSVKKGEPSRLWGSIALGKHYDDFGFELRPAHSEKAKIPKLIFASSRNGFGRGGLAELILNAESLNRRIGNSCLGNCRKVDRLLVNAGFSYDSDAMLSGIARFLKRRSRHPQSDYLKCRERRFADGSLLKMKQQTLIIINGADRFFGSDGAPLSAEFDHFLRCVDTHSELLQVLLLCTSRMRRYSEMMGYQLEPLPTNGPNQDLTKEPDHDGSGASLNSRYLDWVRRKFEEKAKAFSSPHDGRESAERQISAAAAAMLRRAETVDRDVQKRAFFEAYLSPPLLRALGLNCPATFEVLRTLSFIGSPVEGAVLLYAPMVRAMLAEKSEPENEEDEGWPESSRTDAHDAAEIRQRLGKLLSELCELGLLIRVTPHDPGTSENAESDGSSRLDKTESALSERYGMHRSLASFVRDRHGAPINDAKLATTFNMSMFMSEPSDSITPEPTFHDELGDLVDTLAGAWHDISRFRGLDEEELARKICIDRNGKPANGDQLGTWIAGKFNSLGGRKRRNVGIEDLYIAQEDRDRAVKNLPWHAHRDAAACLRAAHAVVRGYYSTGALLRFDRNDRIAATDRDGALTEHAHRLDRLISVFGDIVTARTITRRVFADQPSRHKPRKKLSSNALKAAMGPEPFYGDDLVWLLNERATVALAQGHLFEARDALSAAERINSKHVEYNYHGHNWRRIAISQVGIRIERGSLMPAERLLDEIEVAVNNAPWSARAKKDEHPSEPRVNKIRRLIDKEDFGPFIGNRDFTREEIFIVAMLTGYRGLIAHLRGRYHEASASYVTAISMLRRLGEQRAYAHFQRHLATLEGFFGDKTKALGEIEHAISAAQAARQMDILHRARVVRADLIRDTTQDQAKRRHALGEIKEALRYAALADCYRVRIEASASMARHMRIDGDYDTALRYAVDAIMIAARYGHSLQKTSLRIELGRILEARGDPISGRALLEMAVSIGTSKGYFHALERVRRVLKPSSPAVNWAHFRTSG